VRIAVVLGVSIALSTTPTVAIADPRPPRPATPAPSAPTPSVGADARPAPPPAAAPAQPAAPPVAPSAPASPPPDAPKPAPADAATSAAPSPAPAPKRPIVGFAVRGRSKLEPQTLGYLSHTEIGNLIDPSDIPRIQQALVSSELFKTVAVSIEPAPGDPSPGVILVATVTDKHSWIVAPTVFALPGNTAVGFGYAENNFRGLNQKYLLYGQIGTRTSLLFGTFLDPAYRGTKLTWRTDLYVFRRALGEYTNPPDDPRSSDVSRTTTTTYLGGGALIGWNFRWWLVGDLRLRGAYVYFRNPQTETGEPLARPEKDGWDITLQAHLTIDARHHRYGVTWGPYLQLTLEPSVPGLDSYGYQVALLRAYQSWRFFGEHELELRTQLHWGRHLPAHEELTLGGVVDLRGYNVDQFRGDLRAVFRTEYSVPLFKWRFLSFRAIAFYDAGYIGFHNRRPSDRDYLPNQLTADYYRTNVGTGLRIYLDNIVLPLLGFDLAYGIEGHSPEIYFEVGLTDF
jgi:outer membrane protein insertion porin family